MNICDFIKENNLPHKVENGKVVQNGTLVLSNNQITSLNGFVQNGDLDLSKWSFSKIENNSLSIGCKNKTLYEWKQFFDNNEYFETKPDTVEYQQIKNHFEMVYKLYKNK